MNILFIEDSLTFAKMTVNQLTKLGHTVKHVANGKDAEEQFGVSGYDVVLMDFMLPDTDAIQLLKLIKTIEFSVPVIVISAKDND